MKNFILLLTFIILGMQSLIAQLIPNEYISEKKYEELRERQINIEYDVQMLSQKQKEYPMFANFIKNL